MQEVSNGCQLQLYSQTSSSPYWVQIYQSVRWVTAVQDKNGQMPSWASNISYGRWMAWYISGYRQCRGRKVISQHICHTPKLKIRHNINSNSQFFVLSVKGKNTLKNRMWANAQRDGRPALCSTPQSLANANCRAVTLPRRKTRWNL